MADSSIRLNTNTSTGADVDTRTTSAGDHRQVIVIGEGAATSDAVVPADATYGLLTNISDRVGRWVGTIALASGSSISLNSAGTLSVTVSSSGSTVAASQYGTWNIGSITNGLPSGVNWLGTVALASGTSVSTAAGVQAITFNSQQGSGTSTGAMRVELPTNGTGVVGLNQGLNWIGTVALASSTSVSISSTGSTVAASQYGNWSVSISSSGSTVAASQYGTWNVVNSQGFNWIGTVALASSTSVSITSTGSTVAVTDNLGSLTVDAPVTAPVFVTPTPSTTGGWSPIPITGLFVSSQGIIKSSAGTLGGYYIYNPNTSVTYCQVFDSSSGVTVGSTANKMTLGIPAMSAANISWDCGVNFASGIRVAATTTASGSTAPTSGLDCTFYYK